MGPNRGNSRKAIETCNFRRPGWNKGIAVRIGATAERRLRLLRHVGFIDFEIDSPNRGNSRKAIETS